MESVVQCPVCTLFLHPGMSLEEHLNTHPKDQVILALSQLTLQRANILSGTQFSPAKSPSPTTQPVTPQNTSSIPTEVNGNQFPCIFPSPSTNSNRKDTTTLLIQVQPGRTSPQIFNTATSPQDASPKNLMIVNQFVPQQQQQRQAAASPPKQRQSLAITYTEPPSLVPRYTSERYSGPPPPYSTAISSTSFNNFTSIARDSYLGSSNENSSSSYEVKAHYMEKEDGNFVVTEPPQKIVEYSEDENGELTLSEKVVKSPPRLVPCTSDEDDDDRIQNVEEPVPADTLYVSEPILVEKVTVEAMDEITCTTPKNKRKVTNGLKVLSNVKITNDMISPGLQEIIANRKGRRINKILNKRPLQHSPQPSTSSHCDDEVMDLTQNRNNNIDLDAPSTSRKHLPERYEMDSLEEHYQTLSDMPSEDALEQAEVMQDEDFHEEEEEDDNHEDFDDDECRMSPPPATPTSVIRTINDVTAEPTIKSETPETLPPTIMSPKPSTSSQDSHLNANNLQKTSKIGQPILQKPKKLLLKLKKTIPCQNIDNSVVKIKVEPELEPQPEIFNHHVKVKQEKFDYSFEFQAKSHDDDAANECPEVIEPENVAEAGPSHHETISSSFTIAHMEEGEIIEEPEEVAENPDEKMQYVMYIPPPPQQQQQETNAVPLSWVQRFSPQYVPFDERSSYMEMEGSFGKNSNSVSLTSEGDTRNGQSSNSFDDRAPSADSCLNIRTDEKMPAKGEISEQESNGEIDNWNQVYQDPIQQYPSSYDVSTAQECWNLSNNKPEFMQQQQQYATL